MRKHFYHNLIEIDFITTILAEEGFSKEEQQELINLAHSNLHLSILDVILSELSEEDKKNFLQLAEKDEHAKTWEFLQARISNIEDRIKKIALEMKKEMHEDIKKAKK